MSENEDDGLKSVIKASAGAVTELAKADQEQQKTYQSALDLVKRAGAYLGGVFEPASKELSHLFGDQMRYWRFKNAANILQKAQALIDERGLKPEQLKALGFGDGLLLLEAASLEEDVSVQDMWAQLMANSVDPQQQTKAQKIYIDLLKSLSSREVALLNLLWEFGKWHRSTAEQNAHWNRVREMADSKWRQFSPEERSVSIQNLVRLRCITYKAKSVDVGGLCAELPRDRHNTWGPRWAAVDPRKLEEVIKGLIDQQLIASGLKDFPQHYSGPPYPDAMPEADFVLTPLKRDGIRFDSLNF